jgi:hypothetical protein
MSMKVDFSLAWKSGAQILNEMLALLPNLVLGLAILVLFLFVASFARAFARRIALRRLSHQGMALLLQEPFRLGDLISVTGIEGNVSDIQARATVVTTKEGREVIIPNAVIFTNPVAVSHDTRAS